MRKTLLTRLAAVAAGGALAWVAVTPAFAQDDTTVDIKADQVPTTAAEFDEQECDGPFGNLAEDQDGWHFILTQYSGELSELSMSFDFEDGSGTPVSIDADPAEFDRPGMSDTVHLSLVTDAGWTLVGAQAAGPADGFGGNSQFNLSHTCPGVPGNGKPTPTPSPTPSEPGGNGEGGGENGDDEEGGLPITGLEVGGLAALGTGLVAAGMALLLVRRRTQTGLTDG